MNWIPDKFNVGYNYYSDNLPKEEGNRRSRDGGDDDDDDVLNLSKIKVK